MLWWQFRPAVLWCSPNIRYDQVPHITRPLGWPHYFARMLPSISSFKTLYISVFILLVGTPHPYRCRSETTPQTIFSSAVPPITTICCRPSSCLFVCLCACPPPTDGANAIMPCAQILVLQVISPIFQNMPRLPSPLGTFLYPSFLRLPWFDRLTALGVVASVVDWDNTPEAWRK